MTTDQYIKRQHDKIAELQKGKPIAIAAQDTHVKMVERIFENGKEANGGKNKYNSTDPIYVNPDNSPNKFTTKGKTGKSKFKNGSDHKTGYFKSYKSFRQKVGRETSFMNLDLFGVLKSDFSKGTIKLDDSKYASTVTNEANKGKVQKFAGYFQLSKDERVNFKEVLTDESLKILR